MLSNQINRLPPKKMSINVRIRNYALHSGRVPQRAQSNNSNHLSTQGNLDRLKQALQTLSTPHFDLAVLHTFSFSSFLQLCIDSNAEKEGRLLHQHLLRNGYVSDLHLNTKFIHFYSRIGDLSAARRVFDEMPERSIVSWTALISGYSRNGYSREALEVFSGMHRCGFRANQFSYGSVLPACTDLSCIGSGMQIQGCIEKSRYVRDLFVQSALVDLHSKCGKIEDARYVFERMSQRDVICWNALIGGYVVQGLGDSAFGMLRSMLRDGINPDHFTFGSILKACGGDRALMKVNQIHGLIAHLGLEFHGVVIGSLINAYAKCRNLISARLLYDSILQKDLISVTALITGYAQEGNYSGDAFELFSKINQMGIGMDDVIMCSMLNICGHVTSLSMGQQIHAHALKNRPNYDVAMGNALIDMYAKSGEIDDARCAFDEMQEKNVISWTSLMAGYGKHGYGEEAIALFEQMEEKQLKPNEITFLSLLFACSHSGLTNEGWRLFYSMVSKYKICPRNEHYACMIDILARGGRIKEAYDMICRMNVKPNASLWGAVLGASRIYGNTSLGEMAAAHLFDLDPKNPVNYVVLANIYAAAGLWEDACNMRKLMEVKCIKKEPGYSCIEFTKKSMALLEVI